MHRLDLGLYSHPKEFLGNGLQTHVNSKRKIISTRKVLRGGLNPRRCIRQGSETNTLPTELFQTLLSDLNVVPFCEFFFFFFVGCSIVGVWLQYCKHSDVFWYKYTLGATAGATRRRQCDFGFGLTFFPVSFDTTVGHVVRVCVCIFVGVDRRVCACGVVLCW